MANELLTPTLDALKAHAYDCLVQIEAWQAKLRKSHEAGQLDAWQAKLREANEAIAQYMAQQAEKKDEAKE